jgi:type I restriction enzyme, S subunit
MNLVPLGEVANIDRTTASLEECKLLPYVGLEHIEKESGHFAPEFKKQPETLLATKFKFTDKHVLYGKLRPYLKKVALPYFEGVCTTEILPILPKEDKLDRKYLYAVLLSNEFVKWASARVSGANLPRLDPKLLNDYRIPLPPLEEQKRIAGIFEGADKLRRQRRYAQELSDNLLLSIFIQMFGNPNDYAERWQEVALADLLSEPLANGITLTQESMGYGTKLVNISDLYESHTINTATLGRAFASEKQLKKSLLREGDIVFVRSSVKRAGAAMCAYFPGDKEPVTFGCFNIRLRPKTNTIHPLFLSFFLRSPEGRRRLLRFCQTATITNINQEGLEAVAVPLPPIELQKTFVSTADRFERLSIQQREVTRQAEHLFETLLHRAFRGEL